MKIDITEAILEIYKEEKAIEILTKIQENATGNLELKKVDRLYLDALIERNQEAQLQLKRVQRIITKRL